MGRAGRKNEYSLTATPGRVKLSRREVRSATEEAIERDTRLRERARRADGLLVARAGRKQPITEFTRKSQLEMRWAYNALPWDELGPRLAMVTLTYPREFPMDGLQVRRHRKLWFQRWGRYWKEPCQGAWALEFQERGAPHIHTYVRMPEGARLEFDEMRDDKVWPWALETWADIVQSGDPLHEVYGVDVRPCSYGSGLQNAKRIADYFWRESGKKRQKTPPEGYGKVGQFWGYVGMKKREYVLALCREDYVAMRRPLRLYRDKENGRKVQRGRGRGSSMDGLRTYMADGVGMAVRLKSWAEDVGDNS